MTARRSSASGRAGWNVEPERSGGAVAARRAVRCAVYTRKSSEEGLSQAFNSLDAQREACEVYVRSQQHEGWIVLPTLYDDGGFSGGTMERPALRRLLADIRSGSVDVVVVYKIDRLTRSLFDFARIVETFDTASVSFVSITQSFNTTTSMGRLTLNVLLSFAQFEREVTGERIRDKIALSKRKGMWMGGNVPLGYDARDRKLVVNEAEAATVRTIFQLYAERGTVRAVKDELDRLGLRTKTRGGAPEGSITAPISNSVRNRTTAPTAARAAGNQPFGIGHLFTILRNPLYVGQIRHRSETHPGEHQAIVSKALWRSVQRQLDRNAVDRMEGQSRKASSLLTGRIVDASGNRLTPSHAVKGTKRYRYYVTSGRDLASDATLRVPATDIETLVVDAVRELLLDQNRLTDAISSAASAPDLAPVMLRQAIERGARLAERLADPSGMDSSGIVRRLVARVVVSPTAAGIQIDRTVLAGSLLGESNVAPGNVADFPTDADELDAGDAPAHTMEDAAGSDDAAAEPLLIERAIALRRLGREQRLVITSATAPAAAKPDAVLIRAIVRARTWFGALRDRRVDSIAELGRREGIARTIVSHHLPLAFLAPDITEAVVEGRQPLGLTLEGLVAIAAASPRWDRQRSMFQAS